MNFRRLLMGSVLALPLIFGAPSIAHADPVSVAIITTLGFTATAGAVAATTSFLINAALFAASSVVSKLGKQKTAVAERQASVTSLSLGEVPREAVLGIGCVGGSLVDVWNWGGQYSTDNVTRCIALADHACEELFGYFVDDVFYPYAGPGVQPGFNGTLTIDFRNAAADGHAPPDYATAAGWEADDRMTAVTHAWVTTKFDEKVWSQGHPKFRFVLHGLTCFDPRNGDVWEDRATHSFTRNPTIMRYAVARGIFAEGHQGEPEHLLIGRGLSAVEAPPERLIAPANLCDESIDGLPRYYADAVISADMEFITVEQLFADAMAGHIVQHEGGVEVEPGQAKAAVTTITDGDLVVGEQVTFSRFLPDSDGGRINTVVPRYVEPAQNYADHSGPVRRDLADIQADGGPREMTLSMPLVSGAAVADRNAEIARRMARLERRATIVLPPEYAYLEEGDWIAWQSARRHDGATVRYRIESWALDEQWRMRLSLREIASSVYGVPDPIEDQAEAPPPPVPVDALSLPGAAAQAITLAGDASVIPAIRFAWDTPVDDAMRAIRGEVRILGDTDASPTRFEDVVSGVGIATNGVAAGQVLQARLVPIGDPTRPVLPSVWFTITTGDLVASDAGSVGGTPASELIAFFREAQGLVVQTDNAAETLIRETLDRHARVVAEKEARIADILDEETARIAAITAEQAARVAGLLAEAQARGEAIVGVSTSVTAVASNLAAEVTMRSEQYAATINSVALVDGRVTTVAGNLSAETATRLTQISAVNTSIAGVDSRVTTSANDLAALTSSVTVQFSSVNGTLAEVVTLANTVSTGLAAETSTRALQISSVQGSIAGVDARVTTSASDLAALTTSITEQFSTVNGTLASHTASITTNATAISAETTARTSQISSINGSLAEVITLANTVSTGLAAETSTRSAQFSSLGTSIAGVDTRVTTSATDLAALTSSVTSQFSSLNGTVASHTTLIGTNATAISAEVTARTQQVADVNTNLAAVITLANTTATLNAALSETVTALSASTSAGLATVNNTLTALSNADTVLASSISTAQTTANGASSSASFVLSALNGNQAYAALLTDVNGRFTGMRINGATQAVDFLAEYFNVTAGSGGGISYSAASKVFKIYDATSKTVLRAGGDIRMWSGPSSVADGAETAENGVLAIGPGVASGGRFNGQTLSGPFDSGDGGSGITDLTTAWQTLAYVDRPMREGGYVTLRVQGQASGNANPDGDGNRYWTVDYRLVSTNPDGSDLEVILTASYGGSHMGSVSFVDAGLSSWDPSLTARNGQRRLAWQARRASDGVTTFASVKGFRISGFYAG